MEIKNLNGLNPYANQKVQQEATAKAAETSRQTAQKAAGESSDVVQLSGDGKLLAAAMSSSKDAPDLRAAKVREHNEQVKNGTY